MKIKSKFLLLGLILSNYFCMSQISGDSVIYENLTSSLILYNDGSFLFKNKGIDIAKLQGIGDDTITYGKYVNYKNKSYYLYSHPEIMSSQLDIILKSEERNDNDNSITIILSSPFSKQRAEYPELLENAYFYMIDLLYAEGENDREQSIGKIYFSDTITITKSLEKTIEQILITIYPYENIASYVPIYPKLSIVYSVSNQHSNYFSFYIPKFTAFYMYLDRFYGKEVEMLDNCTVSMDKRFLLSKCKGRKFNKKWKFLLFDRNNPYDIDEIED